MRLAIMLGLGVVLMQAVGGCAPPVPGSVAYRAMDARARGLARGDARVLLVVTNLSEEAMGVYVLRAGRTPIFLGVAEAGRSAAFDATSAAPRGSRVRFAALTRRAGDHLITEEVSILRAGTIVIEIESAEPRERRRASARRAT